MRISPEEFEVRCLADATPWTPDEPSECLLRVDANDTECFALSAHPVGPCGRFPKSVVESIEYLPDNRVELRLKMDLPETKPLLERFGLSQTAERLEARIGNPIPAFNNDIDSLRLIGNYRPGEGFNNYHTYIVEDVEGKHSADELREWGRDQILKDDITLVGGIYRATRLFHEPFGRKTHWVVGMHNGQFWFAHNHYIRFSDATQYVYKMHQNNRQFVYNAGRHHVFEGYHPSYKAATKRDGRDSIIEWDVYKP